MATRKTSKPAVEFVADEIRFTVGAAEIGAAEGWLKNEVALADAVATFFDRVILAHRVDLTVLEPLAKGTTRSNDAQAAYLFVRTLFTVRQVGDACAAAMADKNVSGDRILQPLKRKPQAKRALQQSVLGSKEWGRFVRALKDEAARRDGTADAGRGASSKKSDYEYVRDTVGAVIKRLARDVEKQDGSIKPEVAGKLAAFLRDTLKGYGIK